MVDGIPLLLLPGLLCDAALWQHQITHLEGIAACHVADLTRHDRIDALAKDALAPAPQRFAMAGLSMGGYVAFEIMRQAPDRVLKLCLLDTSARADTAEQIHRRRLLLKMAETGQFKGVTPRLLPMLIHPDRTGDIELTETVTAMAERVGRDVFQKQQTAILNRIDSRASLRSIKCPVQIVCGREDALTPPDIMREIADGVPHARMDVIEACGHLSTLEKPGEVNYLMRRWLMP
jgi:pimeloyl-ACP methyl ester carboxylesterase